MSRIPEDELERLKREVPLAELCRARGVELAGHGGKDLKGRCPFHEDKEASFMVSPGKNLFNCFGCGAGGGPVDFVMRFESVSFRHAVEILRSSPGASSRRQPSTTPTASSA